MTRSRLSAFSRITLAAGVAVASTASAEAQPPSGPAAQAADPFLPAEDESFLLTEPTTLSEFRRLEMPVLYMVGKRSPVSARAVAQLLTATLPRVQVLEFDELGHMGPITHPAIVNEAIRQFLG